MKERLRGRIRPLTTNRIIGWIIIMERGTESGFNKQDELGSGNPYGKME
jgi:hypothetical protein